MIWNHLSMLVIFTLIGLLFGTSASSSIWPTSSSPSGFRPTVPKDTPGLGSAIKLEKKGAWTDHLATVGMVLAFLIIRFFRGERAGVAAAAT